MVHMDYSISTQIWMQKIAERAHCSLKVIEVLLEKYGLEKSQIEQLANERRINRDTFQQLETMEIELKSQSKTDQSIDKCIDLFLSDIASFNKDIKLKQLELALSRDGQILYLTNFMKPINAHFTERNKDTFLLRQFIINYYANLHRNQESPNRMKEEEQLLKLLDMERYGVKNEEPVKNPRFLPALTWVEIGSSKEEEGLVREINENDPVLKASSTKEYCARLYTENYKDGASHLAAGIVFNNNYKNAMTMLKALEQKRPELEMRDAYNPKIRTYSA